MKDKEFKVHWNEHRIKDNINPEHYTQGIECIDYITSKDMSFLEGNVVKYVTRYRMKNGIEDLMKAQWYLTRLIEDYNKKGEVK
mgnify:FL=1|jgi:hypothetical protein|tara:strand:+ start:414 stop:665 length:252 start_codon:yes stop_codon:yes gene_type:complete